MQGLYRPLALFLIPVLLLATAGCTTDGLGGAPAPIPTLPSCVYDTEPVFYQKPLNFDAIGNRMASYQYDPNTSSRLQTDSYNLLAYEMMKWSVQDDDTEKEVTYRFTITLVSPELITSLLWAEVINHKMDYSTVQTKLDEWSGRGTNEEIKKVRKERIYFLLTINSSDQGTLSEPGKQAIRFPIGDMTLTTMSGLKTSSPQGEGIFAYDLDSYDTPIRYYFTFPTAVLVKNSAGDSTCTQLLDPVRDLTFTLGISTVRINGELIGDLSWNFELAHLLNIDHTGDPLSFPSTTLITDNPYLNNPVLPICTMPTAIPKSDPTTRLAGDIYYWLSFSMCAWETISGIP